MMAAKVDFPGYVILNTACPTLSVPDTEQAARIGERVPVAWNRSNAAARASECNAVPVAGKGSAGSADQCACS